MNEKLIHELLDLAEWADANIYEVPINLPDTLRAAANTIDSMSENLNFR